MTPGPLLKGLSGSAAAELAGVATSGSARLEQVLLGLPAPPGCPLAAGHLSPLLHLGYHRQHRSEPLVLDDRRLGHAPDLVEGPVGQVEPVVPDRQPPVRVVDRSAGSAAGGVCARTTRSYLRSQKP
jgi:hypothetical protein